jgi:hypothetical protein
LNEKGTRIISDIHFSDRLLTIAAYVSDVIPSFYFESENVKLIAEHNISVNIDCMFVSDTADELEPNGGR